MNIEEKILMESNKLFNAYYPYYLKHFNGKRNRFTLEKYKPYFNKAARMFCIREDYNANKLIDAFLLDGFKWPQQLPQENVWKTYKTYLPGLHEKKSKDLEVVEKIVAAANELKRYGTVQEWLNIKINQKMVIENKMKFSPILFSFSKTFKDFVYSNDIPISLFDLREQVCNCENKMKILLKIKDILKEDYEGE